MTLLQSEVQRIRLRAEQSALRVEDVPTLLRTIDALVEMLEEAADILDDEDYGDEGEEFALRARRLLAFGV